MERVKMINVQRLLEAAEFLERRERGNGWAPLREPERY
uniref:MAX interactor 1, dimerization protein n=1 Tax=Homo sapiens TaxID=9606 RepID=A0A494C1P8_HUMAN